MRRVQIAYSADGKLLAGTAVDHDAPAHARILPGVGYLVGEFDLPTEHHAVAPTDLWVRVSVDVSQSDHRLIVRNATQT